MPELLLHYIWQQGLFRTMQQTTTDGKAVEVIDVGRLNHDSGPDFFNAKIKIDGVYWVGNVEIHSKASDWYHHGHQNDAAYDSIILHVVGQSDIKVSTTTGQPIAQCCLRYPEPIKQQYEQWQTHKGLVHCYDKVGSVNPMFIHNLFDTLAIERLQDKAQRIEQYIKTVHGNWEEALYILLARAFGFGTNAMPFEMLARSLPLKYIEHHRGQLQQIEALVFGQAGLLNNPADDYSARLAQEYRFLRHKFNLEPIDPVMWKMSAMRPANFPAVRLAQFCQLLYQNERLSFLMDFPDKDNYSQAMSVTPHKYWDTHYDFTHAEQQQADPKTLGKNSQNLIVINVIIPFLYYKATKQGDQELLWQVMKLYEQMPAESNKKIIFWKQQCGLKVSSALDSQALLQLTTKYCHNHDCLRCKIGYQILKGTSKNVKCC